MKNKDLTKQNMQIVKEAISNIKNMSRDEFIRLAESMANFHNYSLRNQILLFADGCSQVASFKKWKEVDRKVIKGAKATWIFAPSFKKETLVDKKTGEEEEVKMINYFVSVPVFDVSQTEGKPIEKNMTTKADISIEKLIAVAKAFGFKVDKKPLEIAVGGYISKDGIVLNSNLNDIEHVGTIIHEMAHGLLGHLNTHALHKRSVKEQEAEMTTLIVSKHFGIERKSEFYLKGWQADEDIMKSFEKINKVSSQIIQKIGE